MQVRNPISRLLVFGLICVFFYCAEASAYVQVKKKPYQKALKAQTRMDEIYQREDFYASMTWQVTHVSPAFLQAQINEVSRIYDYSPAERDRYAREQRTRFANYTVFFVSFYGYDYKTADLSKDNNLWELRLEVDGQRFEPVKFEPVKRPTPLDMQLYPYINPWSRHYFVFFPKLTHMQSGDYKLKINGPFSQGELQW